MLTLIDNVSPSSITTILNIIKVPFYILATMIMTASNTLKITDRIIELLHSSITIITFFNSEFA